MYVFPHHLERHYITALTRHSGSFILLKSPADPLVVLHTTSLWCSTLPAVI